jgi:hypothetical protein
MMRRAACLVVLAAIPGWAQIARTAALTERGGNPQPVARIAQRTLNEVEKRFDERLATLFDATDHLDLLGNMRGVYLSGYGAVFTAEVSLVVAPALTPFRQKITKELADSVRQRKIQRLPMLKIAMKQMLQEMASTFSQAPLDQQMVLVIRFYYEPWEDLSGMPSQVLVHADRKAALAGDVQMEQQ